MANEVEIVVTSTDRSEAGIASADRRVEDLRKSAIKKIEDINAREIRLKVNIDQEQAKIDQFTRDLDGATGDRKTRLELDLTSAQARLQEYQRELASLPAARQKVDIDTADGINKIRQLDREAQNAARSKAMSIVVDTSRGIASIAALTAAVAALGPAALAAAGMLAGIGAVAAVGFGSAISGFSGVGDAVKAMGEDAKTGGGAVSDSGQAVKAATYQVVEARRNLVAANEGVKLAEDELKRAQEDARRAQEDLNEARKEATRMLEDYQLRSEDMALSQRSAALSVQEAEKRLGDLRKDGKADALELARAELNVEEARARQNRISVESRRLTEDRTAAEAKGVEGSKQVVAAQDKIVDANLRTQAAERAVRDAKLDQVRATERLSQSLEALAEAAKPKGGGGTTVDKLAEAMAKLTPEGQKFVKFLREFIDGPLKDLKDEGQSNFLPGIQAGLTDLIPIMNKSRDEFGAFSKVLGQALGDLIPIVGGLAEPFLRFATASLQGLAPMGPMIQGLATSLGEVFDRLAASGQAEGAMQALVGVLQPIVDLIPFLVERSVALADAMGPSLGQVVQDLAQTLRIVIDAFVACAPAAGQMLTAVSGLLPPLAGVVSALVTLNPNVTATVLAIGGAVMAFQRLRGALDGVRTLAAGVGSVFRKSGDDIGEVERASTRGEVATRRLAIAYGAAAVAATAMSSSAAVGIDQATKDLESFAKTGDDSSEMLRLLDSDLKSLSTDETGRKFANLGEQIFMVSGVLDQSIQHVDERVKSVDSALAQMVQAGNAETAATAFSKIAERAAETGLSVDELKAKFPQYSAAIDQATEANRQAAAALDQHTAAANRTSETILSLRSAETQYFESLDRGKEALTANGATLDVHTAAGRANRAALDDMARSSNAYLSSIVENEGAGPRFTSTLAQSRAALSQTAQQMGMSKQKADELAASVIAIPNQKAILIQANTAAAMAALQNIQKTITSINGKTVTIRTVHETVNISTGTNTVRARSQGGIIPGSPSRIDTVPAILAQGEYVVNSASTSRWLPLLEAVNTGDTGAVLAAASSAATATASSGPALAGSGGGGRVVLELHSSGSAMDDFLVDLLRRAVRVRGGDVQIVLGQGEAA